MKQLALGNRRLSEIEPQRQLDLTVGTEPDLIRYRAVKDTEGCRYRRSETEWLARLQTASKCRINDAGGLAKFATFRML